MPAKAKPSRPKRPSRKPPIGPLVEAALREAKSAGDYPLTVRHLYERLHAAGVAGIAPDPESLLKALGRKPLKNDGTIFVKGSDPEALDAPVALPEDQALLFTSQLLLQHLAARVRRARDKKQPKKKTVGAFIKDAKLSGKAMKQAADAITKHLESLLSTSRLPESLSKLIEVDPTDRLLRIVTEASASTSRMSYPVPEAVLREVPGASALLDGAPGKDPFFSAVALIHLPGAVGSSRCHLLARDLPNIVRIHLPEAIESIGRRFPDTSLFSAEEIAWEFLDPAGMSRRAGRGGARTRSKAASGGKARAGRLAAAADAIEAAASQRALTPVVAWLMDGGLRRYFLRSKVEPRHSASHLPADSRMPTVPAGDSVDPGDFVPAFDRAFAEATAGSGGRQIVTLGTLRQKLNRFSREQFDEGILRLWGGSYSLETANDRRGLAAADLAAAIVNGGTEYVYVVRRS